MKTFHITCERSSNLNSEVEEEIVKFQGTDEIHFSWTSCSYLPCFSHFKLGKYEESTATTKEGKR